MENDTFGGAILAWVKSAKAFLKVQAGTGDNLLEEDIRGRVHRLLPMVHVPAGMHRRRR